jgi:hypothetical protein
MIEVELTRAEYAIATVYAVLQDERHDGARDRTDPGWTRRRGYAQRIESTAAEFALAKQLGLPIEIGFVSGKPDVGPHEVRHSSQHTSRLIIRTDDCPESRYVLVTGMQGLYRLQGWLYAYEAQQRPEWLEAYNSRPPSYFVPRSALHPIETLVSRDPHEPERLLGL